MNNIFRRVLAFLAISTILAASPGAVSAQDFRFDTEAQGSFGVGQGERNDIQSVDTEAIKRRARQQLEQQMAALGHPTEYSTQGIGDFFKPGKKKLIELINKVIPPAIKPYIPELPDLKFGKKPKLMELLTNRQKNFMRDGAHVFKDLHATSLADLNRLRDAVKRKDGKGAAKILARLAYRHNPLANRLRAARAMGMRSVTISVTGGGSYFIGADGTHGIAIDIDSILDPETRIKASWYATVAVSGGAQAGASVSLNLGFTPARTDSLKGLSYEGRLSGTFVAGVGVSIAYDPVNRKFLGGTLSVNTGVEAEASFAMGHTEVIKNFTVAAVLPPNPDTNPGINPGPDPIEKPGPRKSLGIYSTMINVARFRRTGERVDRVAAGSAAARAGLEVGDIIISANSRAITNGDSLRQAIASSGSEMQLQVVNVRNGQVVNVTVRF